MKPTRAIWRIEEICEQPTENIDRADRRRGRCLVLERNVVVVVLEIAKLDVRPVARPGGRDENFDSGPLSCSAAIIISKFLCHNPLTLGDMIYSFKRLPGKEW